MLILGATPMGDPNDASPRLREALATADVVAAEDTRRTLRLTSALDQASAPSSGFLGLRQGVRDLVPGQDVVGREAPVHVDWTSGLAFPCQRPFDHHVGVAEIPDWRIKPGADLAAAVPASRISRCRAPRSTAAIAASVAAATAIGSPPN